LRVFSYFGIAACGKAIFSDYYAVRILGDKSLGGFLRISLSFLSRLDFAKLRRKRF
jgi:hypothetical protein